MALGRQQQRSCCGDRQSPARAVLGLVQSDPDGTRGVCDIPTQPPRLAGPRPPVESKWPDLTRPPLWRGKGTRCGRLRVAGAQGRRRPLAVASSRFGRLPAHPGWAGPQSPCRGACLAINKSQAFKILLSGAVRERELTPGKQQLIRTNPSEETA